MSRRNFILLIIGLVIIVALALFWFASFRPQADRETEKESNFFSKFNPFRSAGFPPEPEPSEETGVDGLPTEEVLMTNLKKVSSMPIAGFTVFQKERYKRVEPAQSLPTGETATPPAPPVTEFAPALRYVARATGNIFQTFADEISERKLTQTVVPKVYEAYFGNSGLSVLMRYLKSDEETVESFLGTVPKETLGEDTTADNQAIGSFLPLDTTEVGVSDDGSKIFYLFNTGGNAIGTILDLVNGKKTQIFDSPFTEWLAWWPNSKIISLTTKPAAIVPGHMYIVDTAGKNLRRALGDINGLTTRLSPDGKTVLYSDNSLRLTLHNLNEKTDIPLGLRTLPEKCVWTKDSGALYCAVPKFITGGEYPDIWYRGEIRFEDQLWKIDVLTGATTLVLDPAAVPSGEEIDGIKLALDADERYLFFVNKRDAFLWLLELE